MALSKTGCVTSKSENPEGTITNCLRLAIPVLISKLSFFKTYLCDALSKIKPLRLSIQTKNSAKLVQAITCMFAMVLYAMPKYDSSQKTSVATTISAIVRAKALGSIQGLPSQSVSR